MENSPLSKLAPELRNRIYELALSQHDPIEVEAVLPDNDPARSYEWVLCKTRPLALTQTCKQIRAETVQLFYASNAFTLLSHRHSRNGYNFGGSFHAALAVQSFVTRVGASNASLAREIIIDRGSLYCNDFLPLQHRIFELEHWVKDGCITQLRLVVKTILLHREEVAELTVDLDLLHLSRSVNTLVAEVDQRINNLTIGPSIPKKRDTTEYLVCIKRDLETALRIYCPLQASQ